MINVERLLQDARAKYLQETTKEVREIEDSLKGVVINFQDSILLRVPHSGQTLITISREEAVQKRLEGRLREWIETEAAIARMTQ